MQAAKMLICSISVGPDLVISSTISVFSGLLGGLFLSASVLPAKIVLWIVQAIVLITLPAPTRLEKVSRKIYEGTPLGTEDYLVDIERIKQLSLRNALAVSLYLTWWVSVSGVLMFRTGDYIHEHGYDELMLLPLTIPLIVIPILILLFYYTASITAYLAKCSRQDRLMKVLTFGIGSLLLVFTAVQQLASIYCYS